MEWRRTCRGVDMNKSQPILSISLKLALNEGIWANPGRIELLHLMLPNWTKKQAQYQTNNPHFPILSCKTTF
jgi:hypothetical protein